MIRSNGSCVLYDAFIWNRQNGHSVWRRRRRKKNTHRMKVLQLKHTDKWVSNKPLSDIFHPGNRGTGSCSFKKNNKTKNNNQKQTAVPSGPVCLASAAASCSFLEYHLSKSTLTLDTDCYRNADIKTSVG